MNLTIMQLKLKKHFQSEKAQDIARIVEVFKICGYRITQKDAKQAWKRYSEQSGVAWRQVPCADISFVLNAIIEMFEKV